MKDYDHGIDVWSLGVIMFRLLCGDLPCEDDDKDKLAYRIVKSSVHYN